MFHVMVPTAVVIVVLCVVCTGDGPGGRERSFDEDGHAHSELGTRKGHPCHTGKS